MQTAVVNAKVYVRDGQFESALLIENGVIAAVGSDEAIKERVGKGARVVDAGGRLVLPGMNDSHQHLFCIGQDLATLDLRGARSIDEIVDRGRRFIEENPGSRGGICASGWNQDYFTGEKRVLNRFDLDRISTEIPLYFTRICCHIAAANTAALQKAGITGDTTQPEGGHFGLSPDGTPDGVLHERALEMVERIIPPVDEETWLHRVQKAAQYAVSVGLTSVQSNDVGQGQIDGALAFRVINRLHQSGRLPVRYRHQLAFYSGEAFRTYLEHEYRPQDNDGRLAVGPLKLFKDGSLGARTALMRQDYCDDPGNRGLETISDAEMDEMCALAQKHGMQVITHVIGDGAIEKTLNAYEKVLAGGPNTLRHGLVHCQITDRPQLERIARMGILTLAQPVFLHYDSHIVESRVGRALAQTSYAFRTLSELGSPVSFGSDSPVEDCNPFPGIAAAVNRTDPDGFPQGGYVPGERMTVAQAVDCYTVGSAYAEFCEEKKGRLLPGYWADLIVVDRDIFSIDPREIGKTRVLMTMTGGDIVYTAADFDA